MLFVYVGVVVAVEILDDSAGGGIIRGVEWGYAVVLYLGLLARAPPSSLQPRCPRRPAAPPTTTRTPSLPLFHRYLPAALLLSTAAHQSSRRPPPAALDK